MSRVIWISLLLTGSVWGFEPIIVIHGGTSGLGLTQEEFEKREVVMKESLKAGEAILSRGGSAIDAVVEAIKVMRCPRV